MEATKLEMVNRMQFAKILGCSRQSTMKAEKAGYFTEGLTYIDGQAHFDVYLASRSWANYISATERNQKLCIRLNELAGFHKLNWQLFGVDTFPNGIKLEAKKHALNSYGDKSNDDIGKKGLEPYAFSEDELEELLNVSIDLSTLEVDQDEIDRLLGKVLWRKIDTAKLPTADVLADTGGAPVVGKLELKNGKAVIYSDSGKEYVATKYILIEDLKRLEVR